MSKRDAMFRYEPSGRSRDSNPSAGLLVVRGCALPSYDVLRKTKTHRPISVDRRKRPPHCYLENNDPRYPGTDAN